MPADRIHGQISAAIMELRLPPGTKLAEQRLARIFCVNRAQIREVLFRLARERLIELIPRHGAFVATPSPECVRDSLEARLIIECAALERIMHPLTPGKLDRLRLHVQQEVEAKRRRDERSMIRLAAQFHMLAAELAGNAFLARTLRELIPMTGLSVLRHARRSPACGFDEHHRIVEAVARCDVLRARALLEHDLRHVETGVRSGSWMAEADLEAIFSANQLPDTTFDPMITPAVIARHTSCVADAESPNR